MYIAWYFVAALLSSGSALAGCPNGPYKNFALCDVDCYGYQRCGDNNQVVSLAESFSLSMQCPDLLFFL
jgi:hypothetical protein